MSHQSVARRAALVSGLLLVAASAASAAPLGFLGEISLLLQVGSSPLDFRLDGGGVANANPDSAGLHLTAATLSGDAITGLRLVAPLTDPSVAPILGIQITAANGAGVFEEVGQGLGGAMPLSGVAKVCMFGACSAAVANLALPLSPIGRGGAQFVAGPVNLTLIGAPWTTGTVEVAAMTARGIAVGPLGATSSTAQAGGDLNLVTPIFISSNIGAAPVWPGFARLAVSIGDVTDVDCLNGIDDDGDGAIDFPDDPGCTRAADMSEREGGHACDDGADNDGDGFADFPADPHCSGPADPSEAPDCENGIDDDGDGLADFPADPGCSGATDSSERELGLVCDDAIDNDGDGVADHPADPGCTGPLDPSETGDCQDGIDDDGDGLVDFPADPGCIGAADGSEREPGHVCDDGIDNDGDGATDHPADPGCASLLDDTETSQIACDDGIDDDLDGRIDFPADPGCASRLDDSERGPGLACDDLVDQDGDGVADYPADPGCFGPSDPSEVGECQDGIDNNGNGAIDFPADAGCTSAFDPTENLLCNDGIDNDGDGFADYPADPECRGPTDDSEAPECSDGLDDDRDGRIDYPSDPGCSGPSANREQTLCQDGIDNQGDGTIDFDGGAWKNGGVPLAPPDPKCVHAYDKGEVPACGLGVELVIALPLLVAWRVRRRRS